MFLPDKNEKLAILSPVPLPIPFIEFIIQNLRLTGPGHQDKSNEPQFLITPNRTPG